MCLSYDGRFASVINGHVTHFDSSCNTKKKKHISTHINFSIG